MWIQSNTSDSDSWKISTSAFLNKQILAQGEEAEREHRKKVDFKLQLAALLGMTPYPSQALQVVENAITATKLFHGIHGPQALQSQGLQQQRQLFNSFAFLQASKQQHPLFLNTRTLKRKGRIGMFPQVRRKILEFICSTVSTTNQIYFFDPSALHLLVYRRCTRCY
jgi:hypothetical protein